MEPFSVIYEDDDILAVSKPAGVVTHPDTQHPSGTLIDFVVEEYPDIGTVGEDASRPGVVHRLDKGTSGILLIAKNNDSYKYLKDLFKNGKIKKTYRALVVGSVKNDSGTIDAPIARSTKHFEKRVVGGGQGKAREAITDYKVIKRIGDDFTLLEVYPRTGRTHQIRSHCAHLGNPVACDKLYGGKQYICPEGLDRQFLHARSIEFEARDGARLTLEADLPEDLTRALKGLQSR